MKVYQACVLSTLLYASETIQHALYTHTKGEMPSTCAISDEASCFRQACQACLPSSPRDACPGWDTCAEWKMASSPRTSGMEGSSQESGQLARPTLRYEDVSARRTSRHAASTQQSLRQRLYIEPDSDQRSRMASNCCRRGERTSGKKRGSARDRDFSPPLLQPPSPPLATSAASAITSASTQPQLSLYIFLAKCKCHCLLRQKVANNR